MNRVQDKGKGKKGKGKKGKGGECKGKGKGKDEKGKGVGTTLKRMRRVRRLSEKGDCHHHRQWS